MVALLEGGYFLPSLAEAAALTFRALLGDPCPRLLVWDEHKSAVTRSKLGEPRDSMKNAIGNVRRVLRPFWKCFQACGKSHLDGLRGRNRVIFLGWAHGFRHKGGDLARAAFGSGAPD